MSHIWTFSPQSEALLQQCLKAATPPDNSNIWIQHFGVQNLNLIEKLDNTVVLEDSPDIEIEIKQENQDQEIQEALEELMDPDFDIVSNFNSLQEKSLIIPKILTKLAEHLPTNTLEKLIQHVFDTKSIQVQFLERFFEYFLPAYIKRDNSRMSTDLLLRTYKSFIEYFKILINKIFKDLQIQNNILHDFILMLNSQEQTNFLNQITSLELTGEEFSQNLFNIYTAYKTCIKTDSIQNYILSVLKKHSQFCSVDKNYGKLLLLYLQQEKVLKSNANKLIIESIVEAHKSPFKRPCLGALKEINYD